MRTALSTAVAKLHRFIYRWQWIRAYEISLNRRAEVEVDLWDCFRGKKPLPDAEQCKLWAIKLGVPDNWR